MERGVFVWTEAQAKDALSRAEFRIREHSPSWATSLPWRDVEVCLNGQWIGLSRTDLADDVATRRPFSADTPLEEMVAWFMSRLCHLGARVVTEEPCRFSIIDSYSDG